MVDRAARDEMALLLRRLACGRITNDEFEDALPVTRDEAVWQISLSAPGSLYSDLWEHRLTGSAAPTGGERRSVARWILFLKGEREYEWPVPGVLADLGWALAVVVTLGLARILRRRRHERSGDPEVWPFLRREDLAEALEDPPFLRGAA